MDYKEILYQKMRDLAASSLAELERRTGQKLSSLPSTELKRKLKEIKKVERRAKKSVRKQPPIVE